MLGEDIFADTEDGDNIVDEMIEIADKQVVYNDKNEEGDITVRRTRSNFKPTRAGLILVTSDPYKGLIPTGHAGIVLNDSVIVESLAKGVTLGKNNWGTSKKKAYAVSVRSTTAKQDLSVLYWCHDRIGKPYNYNYLNVNTRAKFYCSQLIWAGYKDNWNVNLNTSKYGVAVHPMELVNSPNTYTVYTK